MRYLAGVIYIRLYSESEIPDYWASSEKTGVQHHIRKFILKER